ncbi:MAG: glucosamine-6-phosphate deaminase [Oscillospiraceae bacterium]|jgi:glucosamine-6-phosphate deaminase|nr:glucosamine-6-phosphate deaminase [Oscillospiraceae bacterium]
MNITVINGEQMFYATAAERIAEQMRNKPASVIGFSTGRTTSGIHAELAKIYNRQPFDTSKLTVFAVDEITNMPRECPASCYYLIYNDVVKPLNIPMENFIMPDPMADDIEAECLRYENAVNSRGQVDLLELGLGENGHLGFNQPGTPFDSSARLSWMEEQLHDRLCKQYDIDTTIPFGALTLGIKNIMLCRKILLVANGSNKADVVERLATGRITTDLPCSILSLHPNCDCLLDELAAVAL